MRFPSNATSALGLSAVVLLFSGCGGNGSPQPLPGSAVISQADRGRSLAIGLSHACPDERLYVADFRNSDIEIYSADDGKPTTPCARITRGILGPSGISVDRNGTLYVSDYQFNYITEYKKDTFAPSLTLTTGGQPQYAKIGEDGTLYVSESYSNQVEEFAPGATSPTRTLSVTSPWGVITDSANNLYVVSDVNNGTGNVVHILKFKPGATTGKDLGIAVSGFAYGLAITKDCALIVGVGPTIEIFPRGATSPSRSFNTVLGFDLALNQSETYLYVASSGTAVGVYNFNTGAVVETITKGLLEPDGVAFYPPAAH